MLKALVTRHTHEPPTKAANLVWLAERASLAPPSEVAMILSEFRAYCTQGRYPDAAPAPLDRTMAEQEMLRAREAYTWLQEQLSK